MGKQEQHNTSLNLTRYVGASRLVARRRLAQRYAALKNQRSLFVFRILALALCLLAPPAGAQSDCTAYERSSTSTAPVVVPRVRKLIVRAGPGTDTQAITTISSAYPFPVIRKCGEWLEVEFDERIGDEIQSFTGWVHFPLTCTPKWRVRNNQHRNTGLLIAPECSFE